MLNPFFFPFLSLRPSPNRNLRPPRSRMPTKGRKRTICLTVSPILAREISQKRQSGGSRPQPHRGPESLLVRPGQTRP